MHMSFSAKACLTARAACIVLAACLFVSAAFCAEVVENYADGTVKLRYHADRHGRKHGASTEFYRDGAVKVRANYQLNLLHAGYTAYHENGTVRLKASYRNAVPDGVWTEYDDRGATVLLRTFKDGKLHGKHCAYEDGKLARELFYVHDLLAYPKSLDSIKKALAKIRTMKLAGNDAAPKKRDPLAADRTGALRRLMAYRFLADVPYENLALDDGYNGLALAAADICNRMGRLDHYPKKNPGMPEALFKKAVKGCAGSNLAMSGRGISAARSIDRWMDDSDKKNIDRVGHRRWCLDPKMEKTGFGAKGTAAAMWVKDRMTRKGKRAPDYDFVCFPVRGYMPINYFAPHYAWNVSLNPRKYARAAKGSVTVKVYPLDRKFAKKKPLDLNYFTVSTMGAGIPNCVIFRPGKLVIKAGARYRVEVTGLKTKKGAAATVEYLVEFTRPVR